MNQGIPKGVSEEERKALKHSGGHGQGHEGIAGQSKGEAPGIKHKPFKPEKGYTGHSK